MTGNSENACVPYGSSTSKQNGQVNDVRDEVLQYRPWAPGMWLKYGLPARLLIDMILPVSICPVYMSLFKEYGIFHIFNKVPFYEEYAIYNKEVPEVLISMLLTTIFLNVMETCMFLFYRKKMSPNWGPTVIHHLFLIGTYLFCCCFGQPVIFLQGAVVLHHFAAFPCFIDRDWKRNFAYWQKCIILCWAIFSYGFIHVIRMVVLYECYGPPQIGKTLSWPITIVALTHTAYQTYFDYLLVKSVVRGITNHKHITKSSV